MVGLPMGLTLCLFLLFFTECASVFCGPFCASAPRYRSFENIVVPAVVVPELKFRDVQRQILAADLVEAAHDAALQERPKAIDGLRVNDAIDVLLFGVPHDAMRENVIQFPIARMFVGRDQADLLGNSGANETVQGFGIRIVDDAGDHVALALDCANHDELPAHYTTHFMHAVEILGYKHPDAIIREFWHDFYLRLVHALHLWPETEAQLNSRLGDNFEGWAARNDVSTSCSD